MVVSIDPSDPEASKDVWELHNDGAASKAGSNMKLILKNYGDDEITYALRFDFQVSNNEAKYIALCTDLRLAQEGWSKTPLNF